MEDIISKLNDQQKKAVYHEEGPALVLAGAGSGKTSVLTARVQHLLTLGVKPKKIVVITFTNKAAQELMHRLGYDPKDKTKDQPRVSTIHGLALSAIRKDPTGFGLSNKVSPLDEWSQKEMINHLIENNNMADIKNWQFMEKMQYHRARGLGFSSDYTPEVHEEALRAHSGYHAMSEQEIQLWSLYEKEKKVQSVVDFDDMLHLVVQRGNSDKVWGTRLGQLFDHVLQDESQDCTKVQWAFIRLLVGDSPNLFVVGDVSQSIYAFAGASPESLIEFSKGWNGVVPSLYRIETNHRSVPQVVKLANLIQSKMTETLPLKMNSFRGDKLGHSGSIRLMTEISSRDNATKMAEQIWNRNILVDKRVPYRDTAILVRSASQIEEIESELVRCRVPYVIKGGKGILQSQEARDILSYFRIIVNSRDMMAMERSVSVPKRGIGKATIDKIKIIADREFDGDLVKAAIKYDHNKMGMYLDFITNVDPETKPHVLFSAITKFTKYHQIVEERYKKDREQMEWKLQNLQRLEDIFMALEESNPNMTLEDVVFQMTMNDKDTKQEEDDGDGKVTISTIHSSKGLEWPVVYVANIYENSIPHMWSQSDREIEEERRLFYVAATRARDQLILCVPMTIQRGKGTINVVPSRFLFEIGIIKV